VADEEDVGRDLLSLRPYLVRRQFSLLRLLQYVSTHYDQVSVSNQIINVMSMPNL
jgi:hypothetical protein